jgi:uncharacterized membrane protein (DUF485 family)
MKCTRRSAQEILSAPKFKQLRSERARLRWSLSFANLVLFFGFIALVWTARGALGVSFPGTSTTIWFGLFFVVHVLVALFTGFYVRQSNSRFDRLADDLVREFGQ